MTAVWYVGHSDIRRISSTQWAAAGITGSPVDSQWDATNGWSISAASFTGPQLVLLAADGEFNVAGADGPRPPAVSGASARISVFKGSAAPADQAGLWLDDTAGKLPKVWDGAAWSSPTVPRASDASRNVKNAGSNVLAALTTGTDNTASGDGALRTITGSTGNTAFGSGALGANTTGVTNEAFGWMALAANTTGSCLVAIGANALAANTTADDNIGIGSNALCVNTTGGTNTAVGTWTLTSNVTGSANSAFGWGALRANLGASNTAMGTSALVANTTGTANVGIGAAVLFANTTGSTNTAVGASSLAALTTGSSNTAIGEEAGTKPANVAANKTITGSRNVFVGYQSGPAGADDPWQTVCVGWWAICSGQYSIAIGAGVSAKASGGVAIGVDHTGVAATSTVQDKIVLGTTLHTTQIPGIPAFVTGDKYLVVDSTGNIHKSSLGPAS